MSGKGEGLAELRRMASDPRMRAIAHARAAVRLQMQRPATLTELRRRLRRIWIVGDRGLLLGLDDVAGIDRVDLYEHGGDLGELPAGCVVVHVRGSAKLEQLQRAIDARRPAGVVAVPVLLPPLPAWRRKLQDLAWWVVWTFAVRPRLSS